MADTNRWTMPQMLALARTGVAKVDLLGDRGTTLCSMDEIAAMAAVIALSGVLPPPGEDQDAPLEPIFTTRRQT